MRALRKATSFPGYAQPPGDDGHAGPYHPTADDTYSEALPHADTEQEHDDAS